VVVALLLAQSLDELLRFALEKEQEETILVGDGQRPQPKGLLPIQLARGMIALQEDGAGQAGMGGLFGGGGLEHACKHLIRVPKKEILVGVVSSIRWGLQFPKEADDAAFPPAPVARAEIGMVCEKVELDGNRRGQAQSALLLTKPRHKVHPAVSHVAVWIIDDHGGKKER
jgi:hypothetical protein